MPTRRGDVCGVGRGHWRYWARGPDGQEGRLSVFLCVGARYLPSVSSWAAALRHSAMCQQPRVEGARQARVLPARLTPGAESESGSVRVLHITWAGPVFRYVPNGAAGPKRWLFGLLKHSPTLTVDEVAHPADLTVAEVSPGRLPRRACRRLCWARRHGRAPRRACRLGRTAPGRGGAWGARNSRAEREGGGGRFLPPQISSQELCSLSLAPCERCHRNAAPN